MKTAWILFLLIPFISRSQPASMMTQRLDTLFEKYFKAGEPGGAVLIVKDNAVIYQKGFGLADMGTKERITETTLFNIGSISKTVVAYGILKLVHENKIALSDPILKYFPDFKNKVIAEKVKVYHLLTHSSGLPDSRKVKEEQDFYLVAKDEENFAPIKQTDTLEFEPGTRYKYSNPAFNGLALIIEQVSGQKWQDYIRSSIFEPAGMKRSTITDGSHPETGVAHGYISRDGKFEELDYGEEPTFAAAGNGGVWSSVEELWKYEQAIQQFLFLNKEWIDISRKVYPLDNWVEKTGSRLGLSWFLIDQMNRRMIGHTGSQGGFISDYCWYPAEKVFYVLLCNIPVSISEIRAKLISLPGLFPGE